MGGDSKPEPPIPEFVSEREIPGAGGLSPAELQAISQESCAVLSELGPRMQWVQSYVTDEGVYCVYVASVDGVVARQDEAQTRCGLGRVG